MIYFDFNLESIIAWVYPASRHFVPRFWWLIKRHASAALGRRRPDFVSTWFAVRTFYSPRTASSLQDRISADP
jgi:hypothetical protein